MRRSLLAVRMVIAAVLAVLLALPALPAQANGPGIQSNLLLNGTTYEGTPVVDEGDVLTLRVQYNTDVVPGSTVVFDIGSVVELTGAPAANTAIGAITQTGNKVSITFKDPWPAGVNQGVFDLRLTVRNVTGSSHEKISWKIDGQESSVDVIVRDRGDVFADVKETFAKSAGTGNLDSYVTVVGGHVTLKPQILDQVLSYTLRLDSPAARSSFSIGDRLPAGLAYVAGSFGASLTSWDADGLNRATNPFAFVPSFTGTTLTGMSFASSVSVPGPSTLAINYQAKVTDVAALEALLQAKYDALNGGTGNFEIQLTNTASFGTVNRTASTRLRGTVPGVNVGNAFGKTSSWSSKNVVADQDGKLVPPTDITYTFKTDLRQWTGGTNFTLGRNVVVSDTLPSQASWNVADSGFITTRGISLSNAGLCPTTPGDFSGDALVGKYCVDGQRLMINVGKDNTLNATIDVKAQLDTVDGLTKAGTTTVKDATPYRWRNVADFHYRTTTPHTATRDVTVVVLPDSVGGLDDSSVFTKSGSVSDTTVQPGDTVTVDYTFTLAAGRGIDVRSSKLVDYVDSALFDVSGAVAVSGTYDGQALTATHLDVTRDADGNLVVELTSAGKALVTSRGIDKKYVVKLALTTKPFVGKETKTIKNKATLFGADDKALYWSETRSEATSYGDEAEVRKRVYDKTGKDWVESLDAHMDGAGNLVDDTYVYRVEFIPHGNYSNVQIRPVVDVLPAAVDFLGFVSATDAATGANPAPGPVDIGGNLIATYAAASGTVTLAQKPGTRLTTGSPIAAHFAIKVKDASAPILNKIGDTSARIVPIRSVSVGDYVWVDSDRDGRQDVGEPGIPGVVLTVEGPDGLPVTDVFGKPVGAVTTDADGKYTFDSLPALTGTGTYTVRIDKTASATVLTPYVPTKAGTGDRIGDSSTWVAATVPGDLHEDGDRDPTLDFGFVTKSYAIGDVVWIDTNRDGIQDSSEKPLAGAKIELLDDDSTIIGRTTSDINGRYMFDNLPAGTYQVRFELTQEQAAIYQLTGANQGDDEVDSDADPATGLTRTIVLDDTNAALTGKYPFGTVGATQGIDPTWDAGVNLKSVSVGDYVWVDSDRDGLQDAGEAGLPGVVLTLSGPDGKPVTDVFGKPVDAVTTGADGRYTFENLPALTGDNTYTVRIDKAASAEVLKPYVPTLASVGGDPATDSSTWEASTEPNDLHGDGDRDPTLDFGFVTKTYAIGDYVWIDANNNGVQDAGEKSLSSVTVELLDGTGKVVATTKTDARGRYVFDHLPAGTYQVRFTLTDQQKKKYAFTTRGSRTDGVDSDANRSDGLTARIVLDDSNPALTGDYAYFSIGATQGIDPTWDAGVIVKGAPQGDVLDGGDNADDEPTGIEPGDANGVLPDTGGPVSPARIAAALALLVLGAGLVLLLTRRQTR